MALKTTDTAKTETGGTQLQLVQTPPQEPPQVDNPTTVQPDEDFNWATDDSVVLREQPLTAIYFNKGGDLVIRQRASWNEDDDSFVFIAATCIPEFLDKLTDRCGVPSFGGAA